MSGTPLATYLSKNPDDTADLARRIGRALGPGDTICLEGRLGAGKTHFARALIRDLTGETEVPSPTYTLVQTYAGPRCDIWHADLYRIADPEDVQELGLGDAFATQICLVEWPGRMAAPPAGSLWLQFDAGPGPDERTIRASGDIGIWRDRLPSNRHSADA